MAAINLNTVIKYTNRRRKTIIALILLSAVLFIYVYQSTLHHSVWFNEVSTGSPFTCENVSVVRKELLKLSNVVQDVFKKHDAPIFLMYGSIWGALRGYNGPLPWDYDIDVAALTTDYESNTMDAIAEDLIHYNITTENQMNQSGSYKFIISTYNIDMFFFKKSWFGLARRVGWEPMLLPLHYYYIHSFPYYLVENARQLPTVKFGDRDVRVPRGGIEIMKYLYRDSWQKAIPPKGFNCSG